MAKAPSPPATPVSPSSPTTTPTSGSRQAAKPPASSTLPIAAAPGKSSTLPSLTAPIPPASSPSPSATRNHGVIAGGDYKHPDQDGPNLAFTTDGGKTWTVSRIFPQSYYSAVAYDRKHRDPRANTLGEDQAHIRLFIAAPKFIYDFRPPKDPTRISPPKKSGIQFNAVSPYPTGGALFVGPKGSIATIP